MDLVNKQHMIHHMSQAHPPTQNHPDSCTNFPIVIIVVGMMATSFLLMAYYTFLIKCCFNWNNDLVRVRRLSFSRQHEEQSTSYSMTSEHRGLEQSVINSIPMIHYKSEKKDYGELGISSECAFCLSEFQEDEKLRVIPNCNHLFHIDCVDVWLQNNANCPLCRRKVSMTREIQVEHVVTPRPSPYFERQNVENIIDDCEDFVSIDLDDSEHDHEGQNLHEKIEERGKELEVPRDSHKKAIKLQKVTSMGDECIKDKDDGFLVQPIRRSFSMDLAIHKSSYQPNLHVHEVSSIEVCGDSSSRPIRSFFSFGHGSRSRSVVLPIHLDP